MISLLTFWFPFLLGAIAGVTVMGILALVIQWREEKAMERLYGEDWDKAKEETRR